MREFLAFIEQKSGFVIGGNAGVLAALQWAPIESCFKALMAFVTFLLAATALWQKWRGRSRSKQAASRMSELLMIDDSTGDCLLFSRAFRRHRCNVTFVHSGKEAVEVLRGKQVFDWVLLDARIPGENVLDTFRQIREERPKLGVAIVLGVLEATVIEAVSSVGFAVFIRKPSSGLAAFVDELVSTLRIAPAGKAAL